MFTVSPVLRVVPGTREHAVTPVTLEMVPRLSVSSDKAGGTLTVPGEECC